VALGHLHGPQYKGEEHIRYSGSILKYSFSEHHQRKAVTLVEIDDDGLRGSRQLPLQPLRDMRIVEGELQDIIRQGRVDPNNQDYLLVRLSDRQAILDPMNKLREVYPNVLHLEKTGMLASGAQQMNRETLKRGELDMFRDFFVQVTGIGLSDEQDEAIVGAIGELNRRELLL
jgi:exonuclease SbcD